MAHSSEYFSARALQWRSLDLSLTYPQDGQPLTPTPGIADENTRGTSIGSQFPPRTSSRVSSTKSRAWHDGDEDIRGSMSSIDPDFPPRKPSKARTTSKNYRDSTFGKIVWAHHFSTPYPRTYNVDTAWGTSEEHLTGFHEYEWLDPVDERYSKTSGTTIAEKVVYFPPEDQNVGRPLWRNLSHVKGMYGSAPYRVQADDKLDGKIEEEFDSYPTGWTRAALLFCALVPYCMVSRCHFDVLCGTAITDMTPFKASLDDTIIGMFFQVARFTNPHSTDITSNSCARLD